MSDSTLAGGLNDDEQHYFNTGGDVNENLARTAGAPPAAEPEAPVVADTTKTSAAPAGDNQDHGDDPIVPGENLPRRVSRLKYQELQTKYSDLERQSQERQISQARLEERLNLLTEALRPAEEPEKQAGKQRPDPNQDIFAYIQWQEDRQNEMEAKIAQYEEQIQTGQAEMVEQNRYIASMNQYAANEPNFVQAYSFLLRNRAAELMAHRYPQATYEQLMTAQIPDDIGEMLKQEERDLYKTAFQNQRNPAAEIYRMAHLRGFRPPAAEAKPAAEPAKPAQNQQQQRPGTPMGAAPPAAAPQAQPGQPPTATAMVEAIKRGQPAAQSLSNISGNAVQTELTPQALAEMSDEQFSRLYNQLMANGDQTRLRELFGN